MEAVKEAIAKDFKEWKEEEEGRSKEDIDEFMEEKYAMAVGKENIFEKIKAMTLPPMDKESTDIMTLAEILGTCKADSMSGRRKREAVNAGPDAHHLIVLSDGNQQQNKFDYLINLINIFQN